MPKIKIVTDSLANLTEEEKNLFDIRVADINLLVDGKSFVDSEISKAEFYEKLKNAKELPKTSQPSIGKFLEIYDSFEEETIIISIHVSSALSGTVEAARQASEMSKNKVIIIDSQSTDRAQAFQVIEAAKLAQSHANLETILEKISEVREKTTLYVCVFTLNNLVKGGRVNRAIGLLSGLMNIKVIFEFKNGQLLPFQKGRGAKAIQQFLDQTVYPDLSNKQIAECALSYVNMTDFIALQYQKISEIKTIETVHSGFTIPAIAIHTGEGAFAIVYYEK